MTKIREINVESGEVVDREMTIEELKQQEADKIAAEAQAQASAVAAAAKAALLEKLGITEDEAKLLLS